MTDILDLIDNATEHRCACGCSVQLAPDGPSAWFASQDCQRRWNESHTTDPDDVYRRPDGGDGWSRDAMVVGGGSSFAPTRFFLGDQEITDFVVPGSLSFEAFSRTVVRPESMEGRSGLVSATPTPPVASSVTSAMADWLRANLGDSIQVHYDTTPLVDASPTVTYSCTTPDGVLSYTESAGFAAFDGESGRAEWFEWSANLGTDHPRLNLHPALDASTSGMSGYAIEWIESLPDVSVTISGYYEPYSCWIDEAVWWAADRRPRIRRMHMAYSARLRSRRRRNRR